MSIVESAMHLTGKGDAPEGVTPYQPKKERKAKSEQKQKDDISDTHARTQEIQITEDKRNYRRHSEKNLSLIGYSLDEFGAGRSVLADNSGAIIGGNGTLREANKRGIPKRIIHTNGDELVVVVRDDMSPDDPRRQKLAIMDNSTTDTSEFDFDLLQTDFSLPDIESFGITVPEFDCVDLQQEEKERISHGNIYSKKLEGLIYEPTGEQPNLKDLFADEKYKQLLCDIENSNLSDEEKSFLKIAATRHIIFDYHAIAEYYAHSEKEMQELMEHSALVIIDFDNAIKNGFVQIASEIDFMREEDFAAELEEKKHDA